MDEKQFQHYLAEQGISISEYQLQQFDAYFHLLTDWNKKINLTAITEKGDVYEKHFYDSISPAFYFDFNNVETLCDVGAGAGFPSIPLKICFPHITVTIVDSLKKRIGFLEYVCSELQLKNVNLFHDRAETLAHNNNHRESYDIVTARAVAKLSVLYELCLPLVKRNGNFLALKGPQLDQEIKDGERSLFLLGGKLSDNISFQLPFEKSERHILLIRKVKKTPKKFPRKAGVPSKNPL